MRVRAFIYWLYYYYACIIETRLYSSLSQESFFLDCLFLLLAFDMRTNECILHECRDTLKNFVVSQCSDAHQNNGNNSNIHFLCQPVEEKKMIVGLFMSKVPSWSFCAS